MSTQGNSGIDELLRTRREQPLRIDAISVWGFKSLAARVVAEIRPLTLLAGANSSGKSSLLQAPLLLKQTLDASFDPGPLKLDGPNVTFNSGDQVFARTRPTTSEFGVGIRIANISGEVAFERGAHRIEMKEFRWSTDRINAIARPGMNADELVAELKKDPIGQMLFNLVTTVGSLSPSSRVNGFHVVSDRFLPRLAASVDGDLTGDLLRPLIDQIPSAIESIVHVPGLRGNPRRAYSRSGTGPIFAGVFQDYTATILHNWQREHRDKLQSVSTALSELGLTWKVEVAEIDETQLELRVGRLVKPVQGGGRDLVSIADVGFGVSQVLPVLVALQVAKPGQLVYIEQPELHLHPRAQGAMASVLAEAARRGVHVVAETHSQELLLGVQTLVAEGNLDPSIVKLHWFERGPDGFSKVTSADLDESGAFGDWPVDFADVSMESQNRYLDAAEAKLAARAN